MNYVACGKFWYTADNGLNLCKLSDYYADAWPEIYATNPLGAINEIYTNNTDGQQYIFCLSNEDLTNDYCTQEYGYPAEWEALSVS